MLSVLIFARKRICFIHKSSYMTTLFDFGVMHSVLVTKPKCVTVVALILIQISFVYMVVAVVIIMTILTTTVAAVTTISTTTIIIIVVILLLIFLFTWH